MTNLHYTKCLLVILLIQMGCILGGTDTSLPTPVNTFPDLPKSTVEIKGNTYINLNIPQFFAALVTNHLPNHQKLYNSQYTHFCQVYNLLENNANNLTNYYTIKMLHDLFSSKAPFNCSKGDILNIPYFWHWRQPNPRYSIELVSNKMLLNKVSPPTEFQKYNSFADIDRTPYLYLSDLLSGQPRYYHSSCGYFNTFGWCSEREMAFVALLETMGYSGKVVVSGNHSWSEFWVAMKSTANEDNIFLVKTDNTFDAINWQKSNGTTHSAWLQDTGDAGNSTVWYNDKAHSAIEQNSIRSFQVPAEAADSIEQKLIAFYKKRIKN